MGTSHHLRDPLANALGFLAECGYVTIPHDDRDEIAAYALDRLRDYQAMMAEGIASKLPTAAKLLIEAARTDFLQAISVEIIEEHIAALDEILGFPPIDPRIGMPEHWAKDLQRRLGIGSQEPPRKR